VLARRYEWDMDALAGFAGWLDKQPRSAHRPQLSDIQTLMQEAWLMPRSRAKSRSAVCIC
jgi:hypothetical protein